MAQFPQKAYKNNSFLNSPAARNIRILCEYEEAEQRFAAEGIENTIVFFGSARTKSGEEAKQMLVDAEAALKSNPKDAALLSDLNIAQIANRTCEYYDAARELSKRLTQWSMDSHGANPFYICSGGGPGIMEAANRGAHDIGGRSVGLGISLPFEAGVNDYVNPELAFEFHYFFTRKWWFMYLCKAFVIFPGGFGTMDELFESLTLIQCGKIKRRLPIVLFGKKYWDAVINVEAMAEYGTISPGDVDLVFTTDSVDDAYTYLVDALNDWKVGSVLSAEG